MKKLKFLSITILVILLLGIGVGYIFRRKLIARFVPTIEQTGDIYISIKRDTCYVTTKLVVKNRSFLKIEIDTIRYKVGLLNTTYLQKKDTLNIVLPAYGSDTTVFSLKIPYVDILKDLKLERQKKDSTGYAIDISLSYSTIFGEAKMPIQKSANFKIPRPPELKVEQIKWKKIHLRSIQAVAKIKLINYSKITLSIKDIRYSMKISKQGTLNGLYKKAVTIKPKGTTFIYLPIEIEVKHLGKTLFNILTNKDTYNYSLRIEAYLESISPFRESFQVDITKNGKIELKK